MNGGIKIWALAAGIGAAILTGVDCPQALASPASDDGGSSSSAGASGADSSAAKPKPRTADGQKHDEQKHTDRGAGRPSKKPVGGPDKDATRDAPKDAPKDATKDTVTKDAPTKDATKDAPTKDTTEGDATGTPRHTGARASDPSEPSTPSKPRAITTEPATAVAVAAPSDPKIDALAGGDPPSAPAPEPGAWTALAFTRRELERRTADRAVAPTASAATAVTTSAPATPTPQALAANTIPNANPADLQTDYTGQPSLFTQVVTLGLKIVGAIARPFGGILAFTGLKIPFITDGIPPFFATYGLNVASSDFEGTTVWTLSSSEPSGKYVVALHGGAYVAETSVFHWFTYSDLARDSGATIVVPDYKLIPDGGTAAQAVPVAADLISSLVADHGAENVSVLGDSAGGGLAVAAVRQLVQRGDRVPGHMALLAPWLDVTMSDPLSASIDDPLLTVGSLRSDGVQWAGDLDPTNPIVSPLFGSFAGLPPTTVFSGSDDMLSADTLRLRDEVVANGYSNFTFVLRNGLIHDWPIFGFLPEAVAARPEIETALFG